MLEKKMLTNTWYTKTEMNRNCMFVFKAILDIFVRNKKEGQVYSWKQIWDDKKILKVVIPVSKSQGKRD